MLVTEDLVLLSAELQSGDQEERGRGWPGSFSEVKLLGGFGGLRVCGRRLWCSGGESPRGESVGRLGTWAPEGGGDGVGTSVRAGNSCWWANWTNS